MITAVLKHLMLALLLLSGLQVFARELTESDYEKSEHYIRTRDGVELYTAVYQPKDHSRRYPFLIKRTPYGCAPYGDHMPDMLMYNHRLVGKGYIFVFQDIRGRSMSDGEDMINLKPVYSQHDPKRTDEATDTYDTIDWLLKNIRNNNGKAGIYGNSYSGWTALMGSICRHKALKAVQAGAPCMDGYFEDFTRYGLFSLSYTPIIDWFGTPKTKRESGPWWTNRTEYFSYYENMGNKLDKDQYAFFLEKGALKNYGDLLSYNNYFYKYLHDHPDYDEARRERATGQYLRNINCPVLIVGGWNDEQNLYGIIEAFKTVSKNNSSATKLIMGPWTHGAYRSNDSQCYVGNIYYGAGFNSTYAQKEFAFFEAYLNNGAVDTLPAISSFNTGNKSWEYYEQMPRVQETSLYLQPGETLSNAAALANASFAYVSDPGKPVPYIEQDHFLQAVSKDFMTADQRFASKRADVLTFKTDVLREDLTLHGPVEAMLKFATDHEDADLIVKLIDVLPMDRRPEASDKPGIKMNGYQQLVRCGYIRGRYRNSFSKPEPFVPGKVSDVNVQLLDVCHTFKKGHRLMIQVQSSLFPLFDRNPQRWVRNIYDAEDKDFEKASHQVYGGSRIVFRSR